MLKFTTTTPFSKDSSIETILTTKPLVNIPNDAHLHEGKINGLSARITGQALKLAGFDLPCFFDGDITELDTKKRLSQIYMFVPSGHYRIKSTLTDNGEYLLDLF